MKFLLTPILLLVSVFAFADTSPEQSWWIDTFGVQIPIVSPLESLDLLIASPGTDSCSPLRKSILTGLGEYAEIASQGKGGKAKKVADKVMKLLDYTGKSVCANEGLKTYVLGSFFISYNDMIHESAHWLEERGNDQATIFLRGMRSTDNLSVEFRNVLIAALLMKNNRIGFLTPAKRLALGGNWNTDEIFGSYDCNTQSIMIDPTMRPFDTGAILQHEMDHFLRDLFFSAAGIQKFFSYTTASGETDVDWESYLTLDESMASVEAAVMQREQVADWGGIDPQYDSAGKLTSIDIHGLYSADKDFNFRAGSGAMQSLLMQGDLTDPVRDLTHPSSNPGQPGVITLDPSQFGIVTSPNSGTFLHGPAAFFPIYNVVHACYFNASQLTQSTDAILGRYQPDDIDPLTDYSYALYYFASEQEQAPEFSTNTNLNEMYRTISVVKQQMTEISSGCALYNEAVKNGKVSGYAGLQFGSDGDHTGEQGSRPGESGSKPGESGSRPGESGSRPDLSVRPCISLQGKL